MIPIWLTRMLNCLMKKVLNLLGVKYDKTRKNLQPGVC